MKNLIREIRVFLIRMWALLKASPLKLSDRILIIAPHPDDEVIGCAGLIQQAITANKEVFVCILTGGEGSHTKCCNIDAEDLIKNRRALSKSINPQLGLPSNHLFLLDFPDGGINMNCAQSLELKNLINKIEPQTIFIPHQKGEGWPDHIEAGNIIRKLINKKDVVLYEYCVWFWFYNVWGFDWKNAYLLSMEPSEHRKKLKAIHDYISPLAPCGKPYSGVLPLVFIKANQWKNELYFKYRENEIK